MTPPRTDKPVTVTFRSGIVRTYPLPKYLRWSDTAHPFDVVAYEVAK